MGTRQVERLDSQVAVVDLAVVADLLDGLIGEIVADPSARAQIAFDAQKPLDFRLLRGHELVDVLRGDSPLFTGDQAEQRPGNDVLPLVVAVAHHRPQRLLGQRNIHDLMLVGVGQDRELGHQPGLVGSERVALAFFIGLDRAGCVLENHRRVGDPGSGHLVGQVQLSCGAGLNADAGAFQILQGLDVVCLAHHHALAVIEGDNREVKSQRCIAAHGPGGVAAEQIDLAVGQGREAVLGRQRPILDGVGVAKYGGGHSLARIDIEAFEVALRGQVAKPGHSLVDAAHQLAAFLDRFQCRLAGRLFLGGRFGRG